MNHTMHRAKAAFPLLAITLALGLSACSKPQETTLAAPKAALNVETVHPEVWQVAPRVLSQGGVFAWQEASIGAEVGGLRVTEVLVNVGDRVRKGQVLARLNAAALRQDFAAQQAALAEAEALLSQAQANAERMRRLEGTDAVSKQELLQYATQEKTARAKVAALKAQVDAQALKLGYATIVAPDNGVVSARAVAVGQVVSTNTELFKLIRQGRLEWRAEVPTDRLMDLHTGQRVELYANGQPIVGKVRQLAPTVDQATRTGLAFVDLPENTPLKAGMFVSGSFEGQAQAMPTLPSSTLVMRDGYTYVFKVDAESKVTLAKVQTQPVADGKVAILSGVSPSDAVVAKGAGFLNNGDLVKVVGKGAAKP